MSNLVNLTNAIFYAHENPTELAKILAENFSATETAQSEITDIQQIIDNYLFPSFTDRFVNTPITDAYTKIVGTDTLAYCNSDNLFCVASGFLQGMADYSADGMLIYAGKFDNKTLQVSLGVVDTYYRDTYLPSIGKTIEEVGWDGSLLYDPFVTEKLTVYAGSNLSKLNSVSFSYTDTVSEAGSVGLKVSATLPENSRYVKIVYAGIGWQQRLFEISVN